MIGLFYEIGFGVEKNKTVANEWFQKASNKGDVYGFYKVGYYHFDGRGDDGYKLAFEFYQAAANCELNIAIYRLAFFYEYGFYVQKDYDESFKLYKKSAENGFIPSLMALARCYNSGIGIQKDKKEALKWYKSYQENDGVINVSDEIKELEIEMVKIPFVIFSFFLDGL